MKAILRLSKVQLHVQQKKVCDINNGEIYKAQEKNHVTPLYNSWF